MANKAGRGVGIAALAVVVIATLSLAGVEGAYRWALADLPTLPAIPSEPPSPPEVQLLPMWRELGGEDPVLMKPIYPWNVGRLFPVETPSDPSARVCRYVALGLLTSTWADSLPAVPSWRQRSRELAVTVWVSRQWSARQALGALQAWQGVDIWSRKEP